MIELLKRWLGIELLEDFQDRLESKVSRLEGQIEYRIDNRYLELERRHEALKGRVRTLELQLTEMGRAALQVPTETPEARPGVSGIFNVYHSRAIDQYKAKNLTLEGLAGLLGTSTEQAIAVLKSRGVTVEPSENAG